MPYNAHAAFIAPARARAQIWRLIVGLVLIMAIILGLTALFHAALLALGSEALHRDVTRLEGTGSTPAGVLALLYSFVIMIIATAAVTAQVHRRSPLTLLGPIPQLLRQFGATLAVLIALGIVITVLPPWGYDSPVVAGVPPLTWILLLPVSLLAVLVQTSAEEILFRGYIQQQLAARFASPLIWMVAPAIIFGLLHYRPDAGANGGLIMLWAAGFALVAADLTARAGTLGPAIALHFMSNTSALLFLSAEGTLSGLALFRLQVDMADPVAMRPYLMIDAMVILVGWLAARLAIRR
ncbi:MAG: lysostaphin resistance A-like protein [Rhodobacterales bacterium]